MRGRRPCNQQRKAFEEGLPDYVNERQSNFNRCFHAIPDALARERAAEVIAALSGLVGSVGQDQRLTNSEGFDDFMKPTTSIRISCAVEWSGCSSRT